MIVLLTLPDGAYMAHAKLPATLMIPPGAVLWNGRVFVRDTSYVPHSTNPNEPRERYREAHVYHLSDTVGWPA